MNNIFTYIEHFLGSYPFLMGITLLAFSLKAVILTTLIIRNIKSVKISTPSLYLLLVLIGAMIGDLAWFIKLLSFVFSFPSDYRILIFIIRIAWAFLIIQYLALALFLESLVSHNPQLNLRQILQIIISTTFCILFIGIAIIYSNCLQSSDRPYIECKAQALFPIYGIFFLLLPTIIITIRKIRKDRLPRILKKQLMIFIQVLILPHLISDFIQMYPFGVFPDFITSSYAVVGISSMLLTFALYYCSRRMIGLRFLNFNSHVQSPVKFDFVDGFKNVLEQLSHATSIKELGHISQTLFKEAFDIPLGRIHLHIRAINNPSDTDIRYELSGIETNIETFLSTHDAPVCDFIKQNKILIYDELDFSNFYEEQATRKLAVGFLESINADIFLPIYKKDIVIAYIYVERFARTNNEFYSNIERDQMIVYASYLGNIINLLQSRNLEALIAQEKELQEELYIKHQEINQYKESIKSFLRNNKQKQIGIVFYKNRRFVFANQAAKELIKININTQEGHSLTRALKEIAQQIEEYKTAQTCMTHDTDGNKLMLSGVPNTEQNNVIITVYYPEISDIIKQQLDLLKDPTKWDYLLYLETTKSGQLINQLLPGMGEWILNFKIDLLKIALSKKAILLDLPDEDLTPTVELLHHVSLRDSLHVMNLQGPQKGIDIAVKLFGINPLFGLDSGKPLLEKLDETGTLFIKNIHFLDRETQDHLAEFIKYGIFRIFKSDQKISSNVRIICSSNQNLQAMVQEGMFSGNLFNELKRTSLVMPSLLTLPEQELTELADGFTQQALKTQDFKNLLELTDKDRNKLILMRPVSLHELKNNVQQMLINKSKKNNIFQETTFEPAYDGSDPELIQAARLGKHALRDPHIMSKLWHKFQNQNKIATFLGVNRSSVNRRLKEYNLE